jgi:hypothetical protein
MIRKEKPGKPISQIEAELTMKPGQPGTPIGKLPKPIGRPIAPGKPKPKPIKPGKPKPVRPGTPTQGNKTIMPIDRTFQKMSKRMNDPNGFYYN